MSAVEIVKRFVEFSKDLISVYEKMIRYNDVLRIMSSKCSETLLRLSEELDAYRFGKFMQAYIQFAALLQSYKEKMFNFFELPVEEQEKILSELKEAVNMMENALQGV